MSLLASLLMRAALRLLRRERPEWARAIEAEFEHVDTRERLSWAFGCVIAAIKQRGAAMKTGDLRISRMVMSIETLGLFGPQALGYYLFYFDQPGVARHTFAQIQQWLLPQPGGAFLMWIVFAGVVVGLIGPIGIFLGLRYVMTGRSLENRTLGYVLIGGPVLLTVAGSIIGVFAGPPGFHGPFDVPTLLFVGLPIVGIAHLMYLARPAPAAPPKVLAAA